MSRYTGPKLEIISSFGYFIIGTGKEIARRPYAPRTTRTKQPW